MNKNDLNFIDLARTLAAFFMVFIHVLGLYSASSVEDSLFGQVIGLLGEAPAAPVFMVVMGILFSYNPKVDHKASIIKGVKLVIKGYLLNFARVFLPALVFLLLTILGLYTTDSLDENESIVTTKIFESLWVIDILQLAGLSYIILTIFQKMKIKNHTLIAIIILISIVSPFLWGLGTSLPIFGRGLDLFWGVDGEQVSFPLFPWIVYPLLGMILGSFYRNPKYLTKSAMCFQLGFGGILMLIGFAIALGDWQYHFGDYWRTGTAGLIVYIGFVMAWLAVLFMISTFIPHSITAFVRFISRNITNFYIVQWLLISIGLVLIGEIKFGMFASIMAMLLISILTTVICQQLQKRKIYI